MRQETNQEAEQSDSPDSCASAREAVQIALDRRDNGGRTAGSGVLWNPGR